MLTRERWLPGTYMPVSLERVDLFGKRRGEFITVQAMVVRNGEDGVGFAFLLGNAEGEETDSLLGARWVTKRAMAEFLVGLKQTGTDEMPAEMMRVQ